MIHKTVATSKTEMIDKRPVLENNSRGPILNSTIENSVTKTIPKITPRQRIYNAKEDRFASLCIVVLK